MARDVNAGPIGIRPRTHAILVGSLASGPSGGTFPTASPPTTAAKAVENSRAYGGSTHNAHAAARVAKRTPPSAKIQIRPHPIFWTPVQISCGLVQTSHTKSAVPAIAVSTPAVVICRGGRMSDTPPSYNRRAYAP